MHTQRGYGVHGVCPRGTVCRFLTVFRERGKPYSLATEGVVELCVSLQLVCEVGQVIVCAGSTDSTDSAAQVLTSVRAFVRAKPASKV